MKISELMNRNVQTCRPEDTLAIVAGKMWDEDLGCLPVINEEQKVIGMITDRDICMAAYMQGKIIADIPVETAMSRDLFACKVDATTTEVEDTMRSRQLHRVPVVDDEGRLAGIVSLSDLVREAERETRANLHEVTSVEIMDTLAAVVQPRVHTHTR